MTAVLIIGASGYIGKHLWRLFLGKEEVFGTYFRNPIIWNSSTASVFLDIRDKRLVDKTFREIRPGVIYHLAYDPQDLKGVIVDGIENVLRAKREWCPEARMIYLSTDAVFDGKAGPYRESDIPSPVWPYGKAKRMAEMAVRSFGGMVVRTSLVYGLNPMDSRTSILKNGLETGEFKYSYFTDEIRCPIYLDDLCNALFELAYNDANEIDTLHITGPEAMSRYEFACKLACFLGYDSKKIPRGTHSDDKGSRPLALPMDISLARKMLRTRLRSVDEVLEKQ